MEKTKILNIDALCITREQLLEGLDKNLFCDGDGKSDGDDEKRRVNFVTKTIYDNEDEE